MSLRLLRCWSVERNGVRFKVGQRIRNAITHTFTQNDLIGLCIQVQVVFDALTGGSHILDLQHKFAEADIA